MTTLNLETPIRQAVECPELLTAESPRGLRVVRITSDTRWAHSHIYMESPVFTPDGRRFIFQRVEPYPRDPVGYGMQTRWREYWLCDIDDGFALRRLTDEPNAISPAVSPDGRYMYYFLNNLDPASRRGIRLMRVDLDSFAREEVMVLDRPIDGFPGPPSRAYSLATIRADGRAVATGVFLGDGRTANPAWGVLVCDLDTGQARVPVHGPYLYNPHPQYARSTNPTIMHDLLVQENSPADVDPMGVISSPRSGCVLSMVRDDGSHYRRVPCGGDETEYCHGHQEWRGDMATVVVGVDCLEANGLRTRPLIECTGIPTEPLDPRVPRLLPDADRHRNDITRTMPVPAFGHTAFDPTGTRFVGDTLLRDVHTADTRLYIGVLPDRPDATLRLQYLLHPRTSYTADQTTHCHPCLSPDGTRVLFNSDYGGNPQIWMIEGFRYPDEGQE